MVKSETAMSDKDGNWLKAVSALRLLGEGLEQFVTDGSSDCVEEIIKTARRDAGLYGKEMCGHCTTHNVVPCMARNGLCHYDEFRNCKYHDKNDPLKAHRPCPLGICDRIYHKIKLRHRFHSPNMKNTDATKWFENTWEIAKCFIPTDGYEEITDAEATDAVGLLAVIINCKSFASRVSADLASPENPFAKLREVRNKVFHSPGLNISDKDLQAHMQLMLQILEDDEVLAQDSEAQDAAEKIRDIADSVVHVFCGEEIQEQTADSDESKNHDSEEDNTISMYQRRLVDEYTIISYDGVLQAILLKKSSDGSQSLKPLFTQTRYDRQSDPSQSVDSGSSQRVNSGSSQEKQSKGKPSIVIVFAVKSKTSDRSAIAGNKSSKSESRQMTSYRKQDGREVVGGGTVLCTKCSCNIDNSM